MFTQLNAWQCVAMGDGVYFHQAMMRGSNGEIFLAIRTITWEFVADVNIDAYVHDQKEAIE